MKLIIGLGNPGKKYEHTRHNAGFLALDFLAKKIGIKKTDWRESKKAQAFYAKIEINGEQMELVKPQTFMNNSGVTVAYIAKKHCIQSEDIIVVHDDKDIPLGEYRDQTCRSAAGHNGIKSIIEHLGTQNFRRLRIGVATAEMSRYEDKADFVLGKFSKDEQKILADVTEKVMGELQYQLSS